MRLRPPALLLLLSLAVVSCAACPSQLIGCTTILQYANAATASPPPKDLVAANYTALLGPPDYRGLLCLPGLPTAADRQTVWSLASGDNTTSRASTSLTLNVSTQIYVQQVRAARRCSCGSACLRRAGETGLG